MANPIHVMVEMRYSKRIHASAVTASTSGVREFGAGLTPRLPGIEWDREYAPVAVPARVEREAPRDARDAGVHYEVDHDPQNATYLLRGTVADGKQEEFEQAAKASSKVVGVFADVAIQVCQICPGDPAQGDDASLEQLLCVPKLQECGMDGESVLVAIVDTGINMAHIQAKGKNPTFDAARSWLPATAPVGSVPGQMPVGHGTMCAYDVTIAAPRCTLLDIALLQSQRQGGSVMEGFLSDAVLAYRHLLDIMQGPHRPGAQPSLVVNNSWGMFHPTWDYPVGHPGNYSDNPNHPFNVIVGVLERSGADILFAAGNCGADCPDGRCQGVTANAIYGANSHEQVLCIAGVDTTKDRVGYSTIGPGRLVDRKPDLAGYTHFKGSGVYPADGGTSAATPVVAGVVAAVRTRLPFDPANTASSPAAVRDLLTKTAEDRGTPGYDYEYGWGIVNGCEIERKLCTPDGPCDANCKCCCCCCCCSGGDDDSHVCNCGDDDPAPEQTASAKNAN